MPLTKAKQTENEYYAMQFILCYQVQNKETHDLVVETEIIFN